MADDVSPLPEGAPIPKDAIDPELLRLPVPRRQRSPLLPIAVLVLGTLLIYRLRHDVRYSLESSAPLALGDVRRGAEARPGKYVSLSGMPDFTTALHFTEKGGRERAQLFRLLGTGGRVLVLARHEPTEGVYRNEFSGRMRRFAELSFAQAVRDHYRERARATRAVDLERLRKEPVGPLRLPLPIPARSGEVLNLTSERELHIQVHFPDDVRVLLRKDKYPSEGDARHEVERLGLPHGPGVETVDGYGYVLRVPPGPARNQALSRIEERGMLFSQRVEDYRVQAARLRLAPDGLLVPQDAGLPTRYAIDPARPLELSPQGPAAGEAVLLPYADIQAVLLSEPVSIPEDALVLLEGVTPQSVLYTLPLTGVLLLFMGINLVYLWRSLREKRSER